MPIEISKAWSADRRQKTNEDEGGRKEIVGLRFEVIMSESCRVKDSAICGLI